MSEEQDFKGWKGLLALSLGLGAMVFMFVVVSFLESLPINEWLSWVLFFPIVAAIVFVGKSKRLWLQIPFFTALGILVIYTIIGVILGNIDWVWPGAGIGP